MKNFEIVNKDNSFPQGASIENLQCYISTELGNYMWTFFNIEDNIYFWYKSDYYLKVDLQNNAASIYNTATQKELISFQVKSWKLFAHQVENYLILNY
jgi:hypothetical protein